MTTTTVDQVQAMLARHPDYLDVRFSYEFARLTGRPETEVLRNVRSLALLKELEISTRVSNKGAKIAMGLACGAILGWYIRANEYNTDNLIEFVSCHPQQCVWAVLLGKVQSGYRIEVTNGKR